MGNFNFPFALKINSKSCSFCFEITFSKRTKIDGQELPFDKVEKLVLILDQWWWQNKCEGLASCSVLLQSASYWYLHEYLEFHWFWDWLCKRSVPENLQVYCWKITKKLRLFQLTTLKLSHRVTRAAWKKQSETSMETLCNWLTAKQVL